jgi:hypothetical protein
MGRIDYKLKILMSKLILNPQGDLFVVKVGSLKNIYLSTHELEEGSQSDIKVCVKISI